MYHADGFPATGFLGPFPLLTRHSPQGHTQGHTRGMKSGREQPSPFGANAASWSLLVFVLVVFVGGALLAPWLYWLVRAVAPSSHWASSAFHRYVNRCELGLALIGAWPLLRSLGATSWRELGFVKPAGQWLRLSGGFALGFGSLACLALVLLAAGQRVFEDSLTAAGLGRGLLAAAGMAIPVAVLEEGLFRGAIFGSFRKIWAWRVALLVSSMIYAIVHFMEPASQAGPVTWDSGLKLLPRVLRGFADWQMVIPGFFSLTLVGIMLGLAYERTGNLYFSIGLHAGWVLWLKLLGVLAREVSRDRRWFFGSEKLIDGWLGLLILLFTLVVLCRLPLAKSRAVTIADKAADRQPTPA
jgi:uncharacterized protein